MSSLHLSRAASQIKPKRRNKALLDGMGILDKATEELVAVTRLKTIEKEHKSYGSFIDDRQLFPIVDVATPRVRKKVVNDDSTIISSPNKQPLPTAGVTATATAATSSKPTAPNLGTLPKNDEQSVVSHLTAMAAVNYDNEELIWKTKAQDKLYFQKRTFEEPDLQQFYESLTVQQKTKFRKLCIENLHGLADKYRIEMAKVKENMDGDGIFHPSANAHRVHCMYLMKLYKGISASSIENPVLRKMRADMAAKQVLKEKQEAEKARLIRMAEMVEAGIGEGDGDVETEAAAAAVAAAALRGEVPSRALSRKGSPNTERLTSSGKQPPSQPNPIPKNPLKHHQSQSSGSIHAIPFPSSSSAGGSLSQPPPPGMIGLGPGTLPHVNSKGRKNSSSMEGRKTSSVEGKGVEHKGSVVSIGTGAKGQGVGWGASQKDQLDTGASHNDKTVSTSMNHHDKLMFNRVRQRKLGGIEAEYLLQEEAEKLSEAEIIQPKKLKFRSTLLESKAASWMLEKMQMSQLGEDQTLISELDEDDDASLSKKTIVPFLEFQKMFAEFQEKSEALGIVVPLGPDDPMHASSPGATLKTSQKVLGTGTGASPNSPKKLAVGAPIPSEKTMMKDHNDLKGSDALGITVDASFDAVGYLANTNPLLASFLQLKLDMKDKPKANRGLTNQRAQAAVLKKKSKRLFGTVGLSAVMLEPIGSGDDHGTGVGGSFIDHNGTIHHNKMGKNHFMTAPVKGVPRSGGLGVSGFYNVFQSGAPYDTHHGMNGNNSPVNPDQIGSESPLRSTKSGKIGDTSSRETTPDHHNTANNNNDNKTPSTPKSMHGPGKGPGQGKGGVLVDDQETSALSRLVPDEHATGNTSSAVIIDI